jgi:YidC/Oxa1 family membrane protein insertase
LGNYGWDQKSSFIDSDKIHVQIQENKLKEPKNKVNSKSKITRRMEQAEAPKKL